jgi:hypothetical protein
MNLAASVCVMQTRGTISASHYCSTTPLSSASNVKAAAINARV